MKTIFFSFFLLTQVAFADGRYFRVMNTSTVPVLVQFPTNSNPYSTARLIPPASEITWYDAGVVATANVKLRFDDAPTNGTNFHADIDAAITSTGYSSSDGIEVVILLYQNSTYYVLGRRLTDWANYTQLIEYFLYGFGFVSAVFSAALARGLLLKLRGWSVGGDV